MYEIGAGPYIYKHYEIKKKKPYCEGFIIRVQMCPNEVHILENE